MKLAVTGGAGFLGYHLCRQLADRFTEFRVLDVAPIDRPEYPPHTRYAQVDVRDLDGVTRALEGAHAVVHASAALPLQPPKEIFEVNVGGTSNVLTAAKRCGIRRVVYISSTAVYGVSTQHPVQESDPLSGVGPYGASKVRAEAICRHFQKEGALVVPILRPKSFVGPGRLGVFQILLDWIQSGKRIPIIGKGTNRYQLLEVSDLVEAVYLCLTEADDTGLNDAFNVGAEIFGTVREDLEALCEFAGSGSRILPLPAKPIQALLAVLYKLHLSPLYPWIYATADKDSFVSSEKITRRLGWKPRHSNAGALIQS